MIRKLCSDSAATLLLAAFCLPAIGHAGTVSVSVNSGLAYVRIDNGVIIETIVVPGGTFNAGPLAPGATTVAASSLSTFSGIGDVYTEASASLDTGELKAFSSPSPAFNSGLALPWWSETVTFTNSTTETLVAPFSWGVDGTLGPTGPAYVQPLMQIARTNAFSSGNLVGGRNSTNLYADISLSGMTIWDQLSGEVLSPGPNTTWFINEDPTPGKLGFMATSGFVIPPGTHAMDIRADLRVYCISPALCDFSNTAAFRFGDLPGGLTWTSGSGVFLSGLTVAPPPPMEGVPEPAAALLVAPVAAFLAIHARRRAKASRT